MLKKRTCSVLIFFVVGFQSIIISCQDEYQKQREIFSEVLSTSEKKISPSDFEMIDSAGWYFVKENSSKYYQICFEAKYINIDDSLLKYSLIKLHTLENKKLIFELNQSVFDEKARYGVFPHELFFIEENLVVIKFRNSGQTLTTKELYIMEDGVWNLKDTVDNYIGEEIYIFNYINH